MKHQTNLPPARHRERGGQSTLEFALVIPLLLLLLLGLVDLARLMWAYESLSHAAREATRYAIVHGSTSPQPADEATLRGIVLQVANTLEPDLLSVQVTWDPNTAPGSRVTVEVRYNFRPATTFFTSAVAIPLTSRSTMIINR